MVGGRKMQISRGQKMFNVFNYILMIFLMTVTLYPFLYVAFASLSNSVEFMSHQGLLLAPVGFNLNSYKIVLKEEMIAIGFRNTLFLLVTSVSLQVTLTVVGAYVISRENAILVPLFTKLIIVTMFFSGGLIPFYLNVRSLGMDNSFAALIFPVAINTFNLIIMRTAFITIPNSMEESAMIDGAGPVSILFKILLPLVIPTVMVIVLYYSVSVWNSWFNAMIFLRNRKLFPLQLVLRETLILNSTNAMAQTGRDSEGVSETIQYAIMMIATLPILVVYPFLQKYFVKGVMIGAVKG